MWYVTGEKQSANAFTESGVVERGLHVHGFAQGWHLPASALGTQWCAANKQCSH